MTDTLKHLPSIETLCYCPQALLSLDFQCDDDTSETDVWGLKRAISQVPSVLSYPNSNFLCHLPDTTDIDHSHINTGYYNAPQGVICNAVNMIHHTETNLNEKPAQHAKS